MAPYKPIYFSVSDISRAYLEPSILSSMLDVTPPHTHTLPPFTVFQALLSTLGTAMGVAFTLLGSAVKIYPHFSVLTISFESLLCTGLAELHCGHENGHPDLRVGITPRI